MKKFKGVKVGILVVGLMGSLVGCISAPPEQAVVEQEVEVAPVEEQAEAKEVEVTPEVKEGSVKIVVKVSEGEFVPSEDMKKVMTGDAAALGFNHIYVNEETDEAIKVALDGGHYFVAAEEVSPVIKVESKEGLMGDEISLAKEQSFKVSVSHLKSGSLIKVISEDGILEEKKVMGDKYEKRVSAQKEGFCFVEIWSGNGEILAISNPIYVAP